MFHSRRRDRTYANGCIFRSRPRAKTRGPRTGNGGRSPTPASEAGASEKFPPYGHASWPSAAYRHARSQDNARGAPGQRRHSSAKRVRHHTHFFARALCDIVVRVERASSRSLLREETVRSVLPSSVGGKAGVAEWADAGDLKSPARKGVRVRVPPPAPLRTEDRAPGGGGSTLASGEWSEASLRKPDKKLPPSPRVPAAHQARVNLPGLAISNA
jgi:hypothetical protein